MLQEKPEGSFTNFYGYIQYLSYFRKNKGFWEFKNQSQHFTQAGVSNLKSIESILKYHEQ